MPEDAVDLLSKLLVLDPLKRLEAEEALNHPFFKNTPPRSACTFADLYKNIAEKAMFELLKTKAPHN